MKILGRLRFVAALVPALAIQFGAGCGSQPTTEAVGQTGEKIIGGTADTTDTWAVGIDIGGGGTCSGTLIAPNLVLTARHCVSQTTETVDCSDTGVSTTKVLGDYPASYFRVYTGNNIGSGTYYSVNYVRTIDDPKAKQLCSYDLALLELKKGTAAFPTKTMAPSPTAPLRQVYTAIGYGCQSPVSGGVCSGGINERMMLNDVNVALVGHNSGAGMTATDFLISGRVCGGDSGGPVWDPAKNVVFGALSRGDGPNPMGSTPEEKEGCTIGIYTMTSAHWDWLQQWGKTAATNGGYAPLPWMSEAKPTPPPDAGAPDTAPPAPTGKLGSTCVTSADCVSGLCVDFGTGTKTCSVACSASAACPTGYTCNSGYCQPGVTPTDSDAGTAPAADDAAVNNDDVPQTTKAGSCSLGVPPPKPQPWLMLALAGLGAVVVNRRKR